MIRDDVPPWVAIGLFGSLYVFTAAVLVSEALRQLGRTPHGARWALAWMVWPLTLAFLLAFLPLRWVWRLARLASETDSRTGNTWEES